MAKRHTYNEAARLSGELYGRILDRNADKGGYEYVLESLHHGKTTVRQHVIEMVASEEFITNFVRGRDNRTVVSLLHKILLARVPTNQQLPREVLVLSRVGLRTYAEGLTQSDEYRRAWGDDRVPGQGH